MFLRSEQLNATPQLRCAPAVRSLLTLLQHPGVMVDSDPSKRAMPEQEPLVLVADDDRTSNARICEVLQGRGMRTLSAPDGKAAVEMLRGREVDLVILDVVMPRMDGFEACKIIKALCADRFLPVVLLRKASAMPFP